MTPDEYRLQNELDVCKTSLFHILVGRGKVVKPGTESLSIRDAITSTEQLISEIELYSQIIASDTTDYKKTKFKAMIRAVKDVIKEHKFFINFS